MVPGTIFDQPDRWQKLELVQMMPTIERLARVLRASSRRAVSLDGAYLERVVVNLLDSPGQSEVFLDDLEISPIPEAAAEGVVEIAIAGPNFGGQAPGGRRGEAGVAGGGTRSPRTRPSRKTGTRA